MSEPDQIPFQTPRGSLFSAEELERLLEAEVDRARRYDFSLCCLLVGVDRLGALSDLYGSQARDEIFGAVQRFLRRDLRTSDFIGSMLGDRLLVVVPSTPRAGVLDVVRRVLAGARKLEFASGGKQLRVTLSVGLAWARGPELADFRMLLAAAQGALGAAEASGGDRFVEGAFSTARADGRDVVDVPKGVTPARPTDLTEAVRAAAVDPEALLAAVRQVLGEHAVAVARMEDAQAEPSADAEQVNKLERRVAKLASELERYQNELARVLEEGVGREDGVASLGKVFGSIGKGGKDDDTRKAMMGDIFQANLALKQALAKSTSSDT